jgi:hypothetical protein
MRLVIIPLGAATAVALIIIGWIAHRPQDWRVGCISTIDHRDACKDQRTVRRGRG